MRTEVPQNAKASDRELGKVQSFVLDALVPLTALKKKLMTFEEVQDATSTAIQLIGNASVRISHLCREQLIHL